MRARLGQYSWNSGMQTPMQPFSWNTFGDGTPQQRLLRQAEESMKAPGALTPQQRLLRQASGAAGGDCYTCANGGDIRSGVDAATATQLKSQGFRCKKDQCAEKSAPYGGYGMGPSELQSFGNLLNAKTMPVEGVTAFNPLSPPINSYSGMMGPLKAQPLLKGRF